MAPSNSTVRFRGHIDTLAISLIHLHRKDPSIVLDQLPLMLYALSINYDATLIERLQLGRSLQMEKSFGIALENHSQNFPKPLAQSAFKRSKKPVLRVSSRRPGKRLRNTWQKSRRNPRALDEISFERCACFDRKGNTTRITRECYYFTIESQPL